MRYQAMDMLSSVYRDIGNEEKAFEYIRMLPDQMQGDAIEHLYERGTEKWWSSVRRNIYQMSEDLYIKIRNCGLFAKTNEEAIRILSKAIDFIKLIYDENDFGFSNYHLGELYIWLAGRYSYEKDYESCAENLDLGLSYAKAYDELPETTIHSSFLIEGCLFKCSDVNSGYEYNFVKKHLIFVGKNRFFNRVRNEQWFMDIIEKYTPFAKDSK